MSDHSPHSFVPQKEALGLMGVVSYGGAAPAIVIPPAVGRSLWYRPSSCDLTGPLPMAVQAGDGPGDGCKPLHATVLAVWEGGAVVTVQVLDVLGQAFTKKRVMLRQPGDPRPAGGYCEWPTAVAMAARGVR